MAASPEEPAPLAAMDDAAWSEFLRECQRHSCTPLAWRALEGNDGVPDAISDDLRTAFEANSVRNLRLAGDLVSALRHLAGDGIQAVPWKGPLLAERAYGDLRLRQFFDLDILVRASDLDAAVSSLGDLGFSPLLELDGHHQDEYVEHMGELELVRAGDGQWLELHTAIVPSYFAHGQSTDALWDRLQPARVARAQITALDPVDELEALCVHGSKHRWERLAWVVDIALLGRLLSAEQWDRLRAAAAEHRARRMVDSALLLAEEMCAATFPANVMKAARSDTDARRLAAMARRALFEARPGRLDELRYHLRMWDGATDRLRYLVNIAITPSVADWQAIRLPRPLFPLYILVRPLRMAAAAARRR